MRNGYSTYLLLLRQIASQQGGLILYYCSTVWCVDLAISQS
ncbi:fimbriae biosynthesis transcriptional regulator FimZ, partial [Salmonella enterica subsp. enterica serovar Kentucky]|nr:fimbriae biosynthesis transcriptional regulator FimZ [Salmonella enterica subsp. enterica serovar Kentucky]ECT2165174.1 fimbriae biosynthesis transcriptional regulator FimZ [Salmonella enterica subsp. enterica serovar Kentucky]ECU3497137.1 fimbriae biosynthesis transcriptional regulator FimZ [Salmonella enterica subsp. enterica serovar Kentucky]EDM1142906.1 fimbriae biosynthesis transcriptional regulator FimZ [Salmonella enterica subsp. enterica serovar Kentucky]EDM8400886.1 fimbriae biosynt